MALEENLSILLPTHPPFLNEVKPPEKTEYTIRGYGDVSSKNRSHAVHI